MQDVFGDVDDLLEMYAEKRATAILSKEGEADEEEPLEPADEEDPDAVAAYEEQQVRISQFWASLLFLTSCIYRNLVCCGLPVSQA